MRSPEAKELTFWCDTVNVAAGSCDTETVLLIPLPETVTVPVLRVVNVLAVALTSIEPFPLAPPLALLTVSQFWFDEGFHAMLLVTSTMREAAAAAKFMLLGNTDRLPGTPLCVTEMVLVIPPPETVTVPLL